MGETELTAARAAFERVLAAPAPGDLWQLQKALLVIGSEDAARARRVTHAFHACLRSIESKSASRMASRWGAVLGTAAVGSVSIPEMLGTQDHALGRIVQSGVPALLEIGAAAKSAQAWEVEARLVYDELAWLLYDELWQVSEGAVPPLTPDERRRQIDALIDPLLDPGVAPGDRAVLVVNIFRAILAARMAPVLGGA